MADKKRYVVKPGHSFGALSQYGPGDVVELTEAEAQGFQDKLMLVDEEPEAEPQVQARAKGNAKAKKAASPSDEPAGA